MASRPAHAQCLGNVWECAYRVHIHGNQGREVRVGPRGQERLYDKARVWWQWGFRLYGKGPAGVDSQKSKVRTPPGPVCPPLEIDGSPKITRLAFYFSSYFSPTYHYRCGQRSVLELGVGLELEKRSHVPPCSTQTHISTDH